MKPTTRHRLVRSHRWLGILATVPLLGWIASSFVLHGVGLALPENGLRGEYTLDSHPEGDLRLEAAGLLAPGAVLGRAREEGLDRVYWLRLQALAGTPVYVVKPGPYELERVYDARSGDRLDPLPREVLETVAATALTNTRPVHAEEGGEFNRYYVGDRIPVLLFRMEGEQPSELALSTASGRTIRRTDPLAAAFEKAYRSVHVWQWGENVRLFTALLYGLVGLTIVLVALGYALWRERWRRGRPLPPATRRARRFHRALAPWAGVVLVTQMLVGAYLWYNLGLIEPRFRGQGSFAEAWSGGLATDEAPAPAATIAGSLPAAVRDGGPPVQAYEWRAAGSRRFWLAYPRIDAPGVLIDAATGSVLHALPLDAAREAAEGVVLGDVAEYRGEATEYWMDFNARVPTYLFRFDDPDRSDVHVSRVTGEVIQRRPEIWRGFGPFLVYHTFGFTGNAFLDTVLLTLMQAAILAMMLTGWRMALPARRRAQPSGTTRAPASFATAPSVVRAASKPRR